MKFLNRRDAMLRLGQFGCGALTLPALLAAERAAVASEASPRRSSGRGKAKSCILVYLWGGPPQMDMWDPNPEAPDGIRSQFKPVSTKVPGLSIADQMPLFANHVDK